jgi:signal transduction histidine kinase
VFGPAKTGEREPLRPSLRMLSATSIGLVAVLALTVIVGLIIGSTLLVRALQDVEHDAQAVTRATSLEGALRDYHRFANLWWADDDPSVEEARSTFEHDLRAMLEDAALASTTVYEAQLVTTLEGDMDAYLARRRDLEARDLTLDEVLVRLRPALERVLESSAALRTYHEIELHRDHAAAHSASRAMLVVAILAGGLLLGALAGVLVGVQGLVLHPLAGVTKTMERFVGGDTSARAHQGGSREIDEVARTFNGMAETIEKRRHDMLGFLGGIAHDLRNPITALKLSWQSLLRRYPTAEAASQLELIDRQLDRLARMVGDLLDAVRIEAGELELELEDLDLRAAARDMCELYGPTSPAHTVTLDVPEQPVEIRADPLRIEQVISNLLSNAIKYSPTGGNVAVQVVLVDHEAELSVSDEGVGIAPESLPYLFASFRRGTETKDVSAGAGLGLSVVNRIVTAHCGHIEVESTPGRGSTFRVRIPLAPRTPEQ